MMVQLSFNDLVWWLRKHWQNPETILNRIGLKSSQVFMDLGCGNGFFAIPAARIVGENGKIYGLDINKDAIFAFEDRVQKEGLKNIVTIFGKAEESIFCEDCCDIVFLANVLHDFGDPSKVLRNARRMIKTSGRLVDVDWKKKTTLMPRPPLRKRFSEADASSLIRKAGFEIELVGETGPYHYIIIAKPMVSST